jgi:hypothetical protein
MKRIFWVVAALAVSCTGKKEEAAKPVAPPTAPVAEAPSAPPAPKPAVEEDKPVVIDEAMVDKYLAAEKTIVADARAFFEKSAAELKAAKEKDSTGAELQALGSITERSKKLDEVRKSTIEKSGLTRKEFDATKELVTSVEMMRSMYEKAGGDAAVAKMEQDIKAQLAPQLAKLPEAERADAEKKALSISDSLRAMGDARDARKKHGDAAVEAVLKRLPEARALREELMAMMK